MRSEPRNAWDQPKKQAEPAPQISHTVEMHYQTSSGFWVQPFNRYRFLQFVNNALDRTKSRQRIPAGLYEVTKEAIIKTGGASLLSHIYRNGPAVFVMTEEPAHPWKPWGFSTTPRHWWVSLGLALKTDDPVAEICLREYIQEQEGSLGLSRPEDWLDVPATVLNALPLNRAIPVLKALHAIHPRVKWTFTSDNRRKGESKAPPAIKPFIHPNLDGNFWKAAENRQKYVGWLSKQTGGGWEGLYCLTSRILTQTGGLGLASLYSNSAAFAVMTESPNHSWKPWKFRQSARGWWSSLYARWATGDGRAEAKIREFVEEVAADHKLQHPSQLLSLSPTTLPFATQRHFRTIGGLKYTIQRLYPGLSEQQAQAAPKTSQRWLRKRFLKLTRNVVK